MDKRKIVATALIVLGLGVMKVPSYYKYKGANETDKLLNSFEKTLEVTQDEKMESERKENQQTANSEKKSATPEEEPLTDGAIGIVEIESLGIKYPIVEGTSVGDLKYAIGHMTDSVAFGEKGNCIICGHNGSRYGEYFTNLCKVSVGEKVKVTDRYGEIYEYVIDETFKASPKDQRIVEQGDEEELTLFTCADYGTNRFVVKCSRENDSV